MTGVQTCALPIYEVANSAVQYLAAGEQVTEKFTVTIDDGEGGTVDQVVEVTITGTNDDPTITVAGTDAIGAARAADARSIATLFSFVIDSPLEESRSKPAKRPNGKALYPGKLPLLRALTTDG